MRQALGEQVIAAGLLPKTALTVAGSSKAASRPCCVNSSLAVVSSSS